MITLKIGALAGSLRKDSFCKKIARAMVEFLPKDIELLQVDLGSLSLYNQDLDIEGKTPQTWTEFRRQIESFDGFLFVTPEYNRSMSGVLKNALDIASRPQGVNRWSGKPGAILSITPGSLGAFGAYHALRQTLSYLNVYLLNQPEMYLSNAGQLFDETGGLTDQSTRKYLQNFAEKFAEWLSRWEHLPSQ